MPGNNGRTYHGHAGIFSTGDAAADQTEVDLSRGPYEEEFEEEDEGERQHDLPQDFSPTFGPTVTAYAGSTLCTWWAMETIPAGDYDIWVERIKAQHAEECGCGEELTFSHDDV